jgi:hypothetical protein
MPDGESRARPTAPFRPVRFSVVGPTRRTTTTRPGGPIYGAEKPGPDGKPLRDGRAARCARFSAGTSQASRVCAGTSKSAVTVTAGRTGTMRQGVPRWRERLSKRASAKAWSSTRRRHALFRRSQRGGAHRPQRGALLVAGPTGPPSSLSPARRRSARSLVRSESSSATTARRRRPESKSSCHGRCCCPRPLTCRHRKNMPQAAAWLGEHSLSVQEVNAAAWQAYVERWRVNSRAGCPLPQTSLQRHLADVKQMWAWVSAVHQLPNSWQTVETGSRSSAGGRRGSTPARSTGRRYSHRRTCASWRRSAVLATSVRWARSTCCCLGSPVDGPGSPPVSRSPTWTSPATGSARSTFAGPPAAASTHHSSTQTTTRTGAAQGAGDQGCPPGTAPVA